MRRLSATASGALVLTDSANTTLWSSQTACLASTPAGGIFGIVVQDPGEVLLRHSSGEVVWRNTDAPPCGGRRRQLVSSDWQGRGCLPAPWELYSADCTHKLVTSNPAGKLQLLDAGTGAVVWDAPVLPLGSGASSSYADACLLPSGSISYTMPGNSSSPLWGSPAGSPTQGPFTMLIREQALQASRG